MDDAIKWIGIGVVGYLVYEALNKPSGGAGAFSWTENQPSTPAQSSISTVNPFGGSNPGGFSASPAQRDTNSMPTPGTTTVFNPVAGTTPFGGYRIPSAPTPPQQDTGYMYTSLPDDGSTKGSVLMESPNTGRSAPDAKPDVDEAAWALWESRRRCYYITGAPIDPAPAGC